MAGLSSDSILSRRTLHVVGARRLGGLTGRLRGRSIRNPIRASSRRLKRSFFEAKVRPVLADNCLECHGAEKHKGGLRLDVRAAMLKGGDTGPAVVPGKPEESPLIEAIRYEGEVQMPPKKKLKAEEIAALTDWVKRGAFWPEPRPGFGPRSVANLPPTTTGVGHAVGVSAQDKSFWSFQPVSNPAPPPVKDSAWPCAPIDRFILAKLEENGLAPAPQVDKATLIRRAFFDLIGLPPTPEEIDSFVKDDRPEAFATVVDEAAGLAALRRAVGALLARCGTVRRRPGPLVPAQALPQRVPLSRLAGPSPQP